MGRGQKGFEKWTERVAVRRQKMFVYEIFRAFAPWLSMWYKRNEEAKNIHKRYKTIRKDRAEHIRMLFQDNEQSGLSHLITFIH